MTDIEVLEREIQCVQRKARINCTNCGSCDLLMDDERILAAYNNAIASLRGQQNAAKNEPLTLEELRKMDGQPVWVEFIPDPSQEHLALWALVSVDEEDGEIFLLNNLGGSSAYEEIWAVVRAIYRRPPGEMAQ